jgi:dephospho-CoA kinase
MKVLGITGGVGAGKSRILHYIEETYHAHLCLLDEVARDLQQPGQKCFDEMVAAFGEEILQENGTINRKALASLVFSDSKKLCQLNAIVHPSVRAFVEADIAKKRSDGCPFYVMESALLHQADFSGLCDEVWCISASASVREQRLKESRGYSPLQIQQMMQAQFEDAQYRSVCDVVIENNGEFEDTIRQIGEHL